MALFYIALQSETDFIESVGGDSYNLPANEMPDTFWLDNNTEEFYPDLVFEAEDTVSFAIVNGSQVPVNEIIGGLHPPQRPK